MNAIYYHLYIKVKYEQRDKGQLITSTAHYRGFQSCQVNTPTKVNLYNTIESLIIDQNKIGKYNAYMQNIIIRKCYKLLLMHS